MKTIKRLLASLMVVVMLLTTAPMNGVADLYLTDIFKISASAQTYTGTCGDNLTWTFNTETGVLSIDGTGAMYDYDFNNRPWETYKEAIKAVVIGNSVTSISDSAFCDCDSLTSITIPDSVISIGYDAFGCCDSLTSITVDRDNTVYSSDEYGVLINKRKAELINYPIGNTRRSYTIPDSVTSIGDWAFYNCYSLTSITIPDSVTSIGDCAFSDCNSLTSITISDSVTSIGGYAFAYCDSLTSITLPDSVTSIGYWVFRDCDSLTSITIPDSVTSIGYGTFADCDSLTSIIIPDSVTGIGDWAFDDCINLTDVYYSGTYEDWQKISIGIDNECLINAKFHYDVSIKLGDVNLDGSINSLDGLLILLNCVGNPGNGNPDIKYNLALGDVDKDSKSTTFDAFLILSYSVGMIMDLDNWENQIDLPDEEVIFSIFQYIDDGYLYFQLGIDSGMLYDANIDFIVEGMSCVSIDYVVDKGLIVTNTKEVSGFSNVAMATGCYDDYCWTTGDGILTAKFTIDSPDNFSFDYKISANNGSCNPNGSVGPDLPPAEDIITGKLAFATGSAWSGTEDYTYKYSDSFFNYDSSKYHHDLALMSMCLEASACVPDGAWKKDASGKMVRSGDDYSGKYPANAETLLNNISFETWKPYGYNVQPGYDTVACTIASKNISDTDTVIAVAVRGAGYEAEWGGNFNMGKSSVNHEGFNKAKKGVLEYIEEFVNEYGNTFGENVKFWIVGYSRGAATANLVAAEFNKGVPSTYEKTKALSVTKDNIYCYTFETPQNTTDKNANSSAYNNIFSIVNPIDPVPKVAPSSEGFNFRRYGVTYYLPAAETVSNYNGKNGIKSQMSSVHKDIYGVDYKEDFVFSEIKISLSGDVSIKENKSIGQMTFMNNLIDIVATEALEDRENYYYNYQGAIQDLMAMFMGGYKTPDADALIDEIVKVFKDYWDNKDFISWHPINDLKKELATVISENTEVSYDDAYDLLGEVDSLLLTVLNHPNYAYTTSQTGKSLVYPHEGHVLVGWMAYLENLPVETRNKLLNTSLKYRTVKVNCPVDVNVYDSNGNLVASIVNEEVIPVEGAYLSTYIDENGQKCIVMPFDEEYRIEVTAREDCAVTCSVTETDGETLQDEKVVNYYDLQVNKDETITCTAENADADGDEIRECLYPITDENGDVVSPDEEMFGDEIETFNVTVQSNIEGIYPIGGGEYNKGEFAQVTAVSVHGYVFDGWYCGDTLVTKENEYRFCVLEDVDLKAVYSEILAEPEIKGKVNSVSINDISMSYKDSATITPTIKVDSGVKYTVSYSSSNTGVASVDENGNVSTGKTGSATITVTVTDEYGNTVSDTCNVEVKYTWWQWIIVIVLFGWIWY